MWRPISWPTAWCFRYVKPARAFAAPPRRRLPWSCRCTEEASGAGETALPHPAAKEEFAAHRFNNASDVMKILYLSPAPLPPPTHPGGACTHIREVVRALERRGHQVRRVAGPGAAGEALLAPAPPAFRRVVPPPLRNLRRE